MAVDTIAGWSMRYAHAFPGVAAPPSDMPRNGEEWDQLYRGANLALSVSAVREIVEASYDRIFIDEYQDCGQLQHVLACTLASIVPTLIFGDPMQGIFEFAGANLSWKEEIHNHFPLGGTLETPHRWKARNPALGEWIAETREKLIKGEEIDLADPRIRYRASDDVFDMATFFDGIDAKEGSFAAIHCNKSLCYRLANAAGGGYQAIEEIAATRLRGFAGAWDAGAGTDSRQRAIAALLNDCFQKRQAIEGETIDPEVAAVDDALQALTNRLGADSGAEAAREIIALSRRHPRWKLYRSELWRDAERAATEVTSGRAATMSDAVSNIRQRTSAIGRKLRV